MFQPLRLVLVVFLTFHHQILLTLTDLFGLKGTEYFQESSTDSFLFVEDMLIASTISGAKIAGISIGENCVCSGVLSRF